MSARVMNPAMMTESRKLGGAVGGGGGGGGGRVVPTRAELAKVRRDLFGPVDHEAARAFVERELKAQSVLDAERWGFDFSLGLPRNTSARYDWEVVSNEEVVPEPYALRGMPYLRKNAPSTPRKTSERSVSSANRRSTSLSPMNMDSARPKAERTPPQEPRVPEIGEPEDEFRGECAKKTCVIPEPTTPVLPPSARKQSSITDFMKTRKRTSNSSTKKSSIEPPEKLPRNAGQIRS